MELRFKQRFFSWLDSYDIYDEQGNTVYTVKGKLSWGHCLHILDAAGNHIGTVKEVVFSFLPRFELYCGEQYYGCIRKEFTFFKPKFTVECNGWEVDGNWWEWDYSITGPDGGIIATLNKELFQWTDTYTIRIQNPADALCVIMVMLAIDAAKCSNGS